MTSSALPPRPPWRCRIARHDRPRRLAPAVGRSPASADPRAPGLRPATPELIERDVRRGAITPAQGALFLTWAFTAPARLPEAYVSDTPWSGTLPLLRLRERLPALGDAPGRRWRLAPRCEGSRSRARARAGRSRNVKSTKHFYLQFKASALQALSIRQYASALETAWATEIGAFKWAKPPRDPLRSPPGGRYPVRIENLRLRPVRLRHRHRLCGRQPVDAVERP